MVHRGQVVDEPGGMRLEFLSTAADTAGELHAMRAWHPPHSRYPPPHFHPGQDEHFTVEEGVLEFRIDGRPRRVGAGQSIDIPRGAVHQVRNPGSAGAVVRWETRPALRTGEFFEAVADAKVRGGLGLLVVVHEYGDVYRLGMRPRLIVRGMLAVLAAVGRRRS
jgi:mannose-6-phosphate isomerase-like protein (cupin superfamily)